MPREFHLFNKTRTHLNQRVLSSRKNLGLVYALLVDLLDKGELKPGGIVDTDVLWRIVRDAGLADKWKRAFTRQDDLGVKRAIGDIIGGSGFRFKKIDGCHGKYLMPDILPKIVDDCMIEPPVYNLQREFRYRL